jgi:predicted nucleotidyltransferase
MSVDPAELVRARDALLARATEHFLSLPGVVGIFVAGSLAAGTADAWSDIDLRVVVAPDAFARVIAARLDAPRAWGDWLFNVWDASYCVSHFRPLTKVDVFYYRADELAPSVWLALPVRILHDPDGLLAGVVTGSRELRPQHGTDDVRILLGKAIAHAHEVIRRAHRGELLYAQGLLCALRDYVVRADDWLAGRLSESAAVAHFETSARDPDLSRVLHATLECTDRDQLLRAARSLCAVLREYIPRLAADDEAARYLLAVAAAERCA